MLFRGSFEEVNKKQERKNPDLPETIDKEHFTGFLKFDKTEVSKMPTNFKKYFRAEGCTVYYRKRMRSKYSCSYEARYRRHGYNISISGPSLAVVKERFIEAVKAADASDDEPRIWMRVG